MTCGLCLQTDERSHGGGELLLNLYLLGTGALGCAETVINPLASRRHRTVPGVGGSGKMGRQRPAMTRSGLNESAFVMITESEM